MCYFQFKNIFGLHFESISTKFIYNKIARLYYNNLNKYIQEMSQYFGNLESEPSHNQKTQKTSKTKPIYKLRNHLSSGSKTNTPKKITSSLKKNQIENDKKFRYIDEEVVDFFKNDIEQYLNQQNLVQDLKKKIKILHQQSALTTSTIFDPNDKLIFRNQDIAQCQSEARIFLERLEIFYKNLREQNSILLSIQDLKTLIFQACNLDNYRSLTFLQKQYFIQVHQFEKKFEDALKSIRKMPIHSYSEQLIVLTKCYNFNKTKLLEGIKKTLNKVETSQKIKISSYNRTKQQYKKCLIKKNYIRSFAQNKNFDFLNFFKLKNHQERNTNDKYLPITSLHHYENYIRKLRTKKNTNKPIFPTNCSACFSDHSEINNPINSCPQCKYRFHKSCMSSSQNCDRCRFKKMGIQCRQKINECFICEKSGFMLKKVSSNKYVHIFCMLAHNLWEVNGQDILFSEKNCLVRSQDSLSLSIEEELQFLTDGIIKKDLFFGEQVMHQQNKDIQKTYQICKYCKMSSQYVVKCSSCNSWMHVMCGYLNGCHFSQSWDKFTVNLEPTCCQQANIQRQRQNQRKYMLNYNKFVFQFQPTFDEQQEKIKEEQEEEGTKLLN